jgi:phospholipid/cholesterol/gamma-HCH transport system substrate-binding protein
MPVSKRTLRIALTAFLVLALGGFVFRGQQGTHVTAYFDEFKGIYAGDDVTVRGVPVGTVTSVEPESERVKVEFEIDDDIHVPDDVKAAVIAQSLVSVRSIALGPVDSEGEALEDGAVIPQSRTAIPVEWDDIKDQLVELTTALGPTGANKRGATSELISAGAEFLDGQGDSLNTTIRNLSEAMSTLSDNSGELFATVRNLQVFITAVKDSDSQVRLFNQRLATVAASLNEDRRALVGALEGLNGAFGKIDTFLKQNRQITVSTLKELRQTTSVLAQNRQYIADLLQVAPTSISNFYNILDPRGRGTLVTGSLAVNNLQAPAQIICGALLTMGGDRAACQEAIGPLAKYFAMTAPPVGIGGAQSNSTGEGGSIEPGGRGGRTTTTDQANLLDQLLGGR